MPTRSFEIPARLQGQGQEDLGSLPRLYVPCGKKWRVKRYGVPLMPPMIGDVANTRQCDKSVISTYLRRVD